MAKGMKHDLRCTTRRVTSLLAGMCAIAPVLAGEEGAGVSLEEVVVKGQLLRAEEAAWTSTTLTQPDIRELDINHIDHLFEQVPGMSVRDLGLGGVANNIVIRGFSSGGHGGDLGVLIDGITLNEAMSHADGYVDLNVVTPLEIAGFTVYKGPVSPLFGNFNRGGLVAIETRKSGEYAQLDAGAGSFSTRNVQGAYGQAIGDRQQLNAAAMYYDTNGFRPQSDSSRHTISGRWAIDATDRLQVALSTRYHEAESDSASYLLRSQFEVDPRGIDPRVQHDGADKSFLTFRSDFNFALGQELKLLTYVYTTRQDFSRWFTRPVSGETWRQREETYDRTVYGAGTSLNGQFTFRDDMLSYVAGVEMLREATDFEYYEGTLDRRRVGAALNDRRTRLNSISAFGGLEAPLHPLAQLSLGLRADRFTGGCRLLGIEVGSDPCGPLSDASHLSPKLGLRSAVLPSLQLRASWAEGFALANGFVKYSIGGQPLSETVFRQSELGAHWHVSESLEIDLAAYHLNSSGEVRTVAPGVYENFGATRRDGFELTAIWSPIEQLKITGVYGVSRPEIRENADARLVGLRVAGVPANSATIDAQYSPTSAWTVSAGYRFVGSYFLDALNTARAESYGLFEAGVSYRSAGRLPFRTYLRVENLTDRVYATSELLLAGQRAVAPGAPRTVRAGIQIDFQ